jgi:hypothetical protein
MAPSRQCNGATVGEGHREFSMPVQNAFDGLPTFLANFLVADPLDRRRQIETDEEAHRALSEPDGALN